MRLEQEMLRAGTSSQFNLLERVRCQSGKFGASA